MENEHADAGRGPNLFRETKFSGANRDREESVLFVQLTTSRIGNLTRLFILSGGRLPKRVVFGNLEGAGRRGRGGKEKE